jgi:hypothetical protein
MSLKFEQNGGTDRVIEGYSYMAPSSNAEQYKASKKLKNAVIPKKVDLRQFMTQVEDQKQLSSCMRYANLAARLIVKDFTKFFETKDDFLTLSLGSRYDFFSRQI